MSNPVASSSGSVRALWFRSVAPAGAWLPLLALLLMAPSTMSAAQAKLSPKSSIPPADDAEGWKDLFDGKTLTGWKVTDFAGHGEVTVEPSLKIEKSSTGPVIQLEMGAVLTGITLTNPAPKGEYEISLEALKLDGSDFFCALTFPVSESHCSLIVGGWGGGLVGISSVDGMDASENETTKFRSFDKNRWYKIRVRVTKKKIEAWIDSEQVVDLVTTDRRMSVRAGEIELAQPFGISTFQTKAALRQIRVRSL